jgi:transposase
MANTKKTPLSTRFWDRVVKTETCWLFGGKTYGNKYGQLAIDGRLSGSIRAHKYSYQIHKGDVPRGKLIRHTCDVRNCVNPEHLILGDHEDNTQDRVDRGRSRTGARKVAVRIKARSENANGRALNVVHRKQLVEEYEAGKFTQVQLAARYRVSQATVSATIRGKRNMGEGGDKHAKRSGHYKHKLTAEQRGSIKQEYLAGGITQKQLAEKYGCDQTYVSLLIR